MDHLHSYIYQPASHGGQIPTRPLHLQLIIHSSPQSAQQASLTSEIQATTLLLVVLALLLRRRSHTMCRLEDVFHAPCKHWGQRRNYDPCPAAALLPTGCSSTGCSDSEPTGSVRLESLCLACIRSSSSSDGAIRGIRTAITTAESSLARRKSSSTWSLVSMTSSGAGSVASTESGARCRLLFGAEGTAERRLGVWIYREDGKGRELEGRRSP